MQSPFPGMDPYLEASALWPDVHASLMLAIRDQLQPLLSPRYTAALTPYTVIESIDIAPRRALVPDVGILDREQPASRSQTATIAPPPLTGTVALDMPTRYAWIEIRTVSDETLVTMIELLSPVNKRPGVDAADAYERKRQEVFARAVHLLEIDLLRGGRRPALVTPLPDAPYFIFLSRVQYRPQIDIWPCSLRESLPIVPVPLRSPDADVPLDLTRAVQHIYASARYDLRIDYRREPPPPPLAAEDAAWLGTLLAAQGLRQKEGGDTPAGTRTA